MSNARGPGSPGRRSQSSIVQLAPLAAALAVALLLLPGSSSGESLGSIQTRIQSVQQRLERVRGREQVLTSDISALSSRIRSLAHGIGSLQRRESRVANTLVAKRTQLARLRARYQVEQARYERLRRKLQRAQVVLAKRLVAIYKSDEPDFVTIILESDGFSDLLERADYLRRIGEQDSAIVTRVRVLKQASAEKRRLLGELADQAEQVVATIETQQRELAATRAALQSRQGALAETRRTKRSALGGVRTTRGDLEGDLAALQAASAQVTHQLQSAGPLPAGPIRQGSSGFIWPVSGPVVSPFGMRWGRLHAGVDIAVPSGTPIRASASGRVAIAGWVGGYGNYTCIQHGGGIATCYGHQASIGVSVGQSVRQGQVIGISDCTGHCFGPHVHFEVRVNGTPVDPMGYL
jgi:murein DD-endopeptidase MepM/ murein hydrolase activator NlpD